MEFANRTEWQYIYNNSSAREQKRMYYNPAGITGNNLYPWQYTLLDAGNKESVLYAGFVNADPMLACTDGTNYTNTTNVQLNSWQTNPPIIMTNTTLYIAPVEFYANGLMSWKVDANNQWQRSYKVLDHLGNVRVEGIGWANEYRADYRPFGGTEWTNSNINNKTSYRLGFLGLQKDKESNLGDHGVRKYDSEIGRFLAIDPLWEKYNTLNPYQYSGNSPVMMADLNGMEPILPLVGTSKMFIALLENSPRKVGFFFGSDASNYLYSLGNTEFDINQMRPLPSETGYFNNKAGRYIYTEKGGWIDMAHFMFYAGKAFQYRTQNHTNPTAEAIQDGYLQEMTDKYAAKHSAYSYEDLPSDKFGAIFGAKYFNPSSPLSFGTQLEHYLNNELKATTPKNAPNYYTLPKAETEQPSYTNYSTNPYFTK